MDPNVVTNYTLAQWREAFTQIPTMSIVTEMRNLFDPTTGIYANADGHGENWERGSSIELLDPTNAVHGRFQEPCGLRIRGGYSRNTSFIKHSFLVFFRRDYGTARLHYPLFEDEGANEFDTFDLRTSQNYAWPRGESPTHDTMVREVFCRESLGAMGQPYRRSRYYQMEREARSLEFPDSPADMALILFDEAPSLESMLMQMGEAMVRVKNNSQHRPMVFNTKDFKISAQAPHSWKPASDTDVSYAVRWLSRKNIYQVLDMGKSLDKVQQDAYTDAISSLPNMKAALLNLEQTLQNSITNHKAFSLLLIDGDNIRAFNSINYAVGDEMIRKMSTVFKDNLRPNDFVARWRSGDEFVVILPDTLIEGAKIISERFRLAVKEASKGWLFPTTISIGVASYPIHGDNINSIIDKAESANKRAKEQGKDQVVLAE